MSRHIPRQRIPSGIVFSAPVDLASAPRDPWPGNNDAIPDQPLEASHLAPHAKRNIVSHRHESDHIHGTGRTFGDGTQAFAAWVHTLDEPHVPRNDLQESELVGADHHAVVATFCLPMLSVDVEVKVDGTLACSELTQTFRNLSDTTIREAKHTFPLYEGATVTAFECTIGDEQCLRGVVKPKEEARQFYREAVQNRRETAALLEEHNSEIFETSLGNIPPLTDVKIKLTYVHELKVVLMTERKSEGIAIIIPTSVAPRYGVSLPLHPPKATELKVFIRAADDNMTDSEGWAVESHHRIEYQGKEPMRRTIHVSDASQLHLVDESPSICQQQDVWKYQSCEAVLESDLVLVLPVRKGHRVQSQALISPPDSDGYAAMQVSLRPSDLFGNAVRPRSFTGEIIFVLDYSGSMHWSRHGSQPKLETMRAAMSLALSGIPDTCTFNVLKFGSSTEGLWRKSRPHSAEAIELARAYTSSRPDLGGTDLVRALKAAVKHLNSQRSSTQIIIITDGELDPIPVAEYLLLIRKKLENKIRFFALGIGDHVSHRLIECVAELGGGLGDVVDVVAQSKWENRLNHLVRAALEPDSWDCEIDLGPTFERQILSRVQLGKAHPSSTETKSPTPYIQAPFPTPDLHPFSYQSIYFLIHAGNETLPREVTVTSTHPTAKSKSCKLAVQTRSVNGCFAHQLAAKSCLTSLETLAKREHSDPGLVRANAEHLGQTYSITSKWTSFVTAPHDIEDEKPPVESTMYQASAAQFSMEKLMEDYLVLNDEGRSKRSRRSYERLRADNYKQYPHDDIPSENPTSEAPVMSRTSMKKVPAGKGFRDRVKYFIKSRVLSGPRPVPPRVFVSPETPPVVMVNRKERPALDSPRGSISDLPACQMMMTPRPDYYPMPPMPPEVVPLLPKRNSTRDITSPPTGYDPSQISKFTAVGANDSDTESEEDSSRAASPVPSVHTNRNKKFLTWEDAMTDQMPDGTFRLLDTVRQKLSRHYCPTTPVKIRVMVLGLTHSQCLPEDLLQDCTDTIMLIQYFRTHMSPEEDTWGLMMSRAESALLLTLGLSDENEDQLEPIYKMLELSIMHQHFVGFQQSRSLDTADKPEDGKDTAVKCPVCQELFGVVGGVCRFMCPYDEDADDTGLEPELQWGSWLSYWEHQVQSGHVICPKVGELSDV